MVINATLVLLVGALVAGVWLLALSPVLCRAVAARLLERAIVLELKLDQWHEIQKKRAGIRIRCEQACALMEDYQ
jgi:hypothetical protein